MDKDTGRFDVARSGEHHREERRYCSKRVYGIPNSMNGQTTYRPGNPLK
jgi:hypothetical protein